MAVLVETRVGQALTMAQVRETITHLFSLGRYEDVRVRVSAAGGGVAVVYELQPLTPGHPHRVRGLAGPGITKAASGGRSWTGTDRPAVGRVADMARLVETELAARGYLRASATPRLQIEANPDRDQATLTFLIVPGTRARLRAFSVNGARRHVRARLAQAASVLTARGRLRAGPCSTDASNDTLAFSASAAITKRLERRSATGG